MTSSSTTVKVSMATRDRLRRNAQGRFRTLDDYLVHLADEDERRLRLQGLRAAIDATPPEALESWRHETVDWERAELSDQA